ncbi:MAG: endonuclease/exonuclease/phosphatase family protein [Hyphomonadaceae bacterium]
MTLSPALQRYLRLAVLLWAGASAAIAALSLCGFVIAPLDLINQAAPFWLLIACAGALTAWLALPTGRVTAATVFAAAALAHGAPIAGELIRPAPRTAADASAPRVRIIWLNSQSGSSPEGVTDYIINADADFVMLAEYHAEGRAIPEEIRAAYPYFSNCVEPHDCNVVILSRHEPVSERLEMAAGQSGLRMVWTDYAIAGAPLRLMAVHMRRPYPAARYLAHRRELLAFLGDSDRNNLILAGDFNATPWSFALRQFDEQSGLSRHDRAIVTWPAARWTRLRLPAPEAFMPLDHVYSGANWQLVSVRRGPRTGADHFPIEAEFIWAPFAADPER